MSERDQGPVSNSIDAVNSETRREVDEAPGEAGSAADPIFEAPTLPPSRSELPPTEAPTIPPPARSDVPLTEAPTVPPGQNPPATETIDCKPREGSGRSNDPVRYFGDYELIREIARGGMGVVFEARQVNLNRTVALKMILAGQLSGQDEVKRFYLEAEAAAALDHPGIVPIYEVGKHEDQHYFSMKLVDGGSLARQVDRLKDNPQDAARLMEAVARAVDFAHKHGILHRDLKPANVLLDREGNPHVTDFGLAKKVEGDSGLTQSGAIMGTPSYMPPEQALATKGGVTTASDVYSLGAILYELLTGRPPFRAGSIMDTLLLVIEREPERPRSLNPKADRDLEVIALKCLEKDPRKRYESASAMADDLARWHRGEPIEARPSSAWERGLKWARRRPTAAALVAVSVVAASVVLGLALWDNTRLQASYSIVKKERNDAINARNEAIKAKGEEAKAKDKAIVKESEALDTLTRMSVANGVRMLDGGDVLGSLPWFARALEIEPGDETDRRMHRHRIASVLRVSPKLLQVENRQAFDVDAQFSPDGRYVLVAGTGGATDVSTGSQSFPPLPHAARSASFSADGRSILTVGANAVGVWDSANGGPRMGLLSTIKDRPITTAAIGPDGRLVAYATHPRLKSQGQQAEVHLRDVADDRELDPPIILADEASALAFSPDGRKLLTVAKFLNVKLRENNRNVTRSYSEVRLWDVASRAPLFAAIRVNATNVRVRFGRDERRILIRAPQLAGVWDPSSSRRVVPSEVQGCSEAAFDAEGRQVATTSSDGTVRVWDAETAEPLSPPIRHARPVVDLSFSPDGQFLATVSGSLVEAHFDPDHSALPPISGGEVRIWATTTGVPVTPPIVGASARFSLDGRRLLVGSHDNSFRIHDARTGLPSGPPLHQNGRSIRANFSPDGRRVLARGLEPFDSRAEYRVWDVGEEEELPASGPASGTVVAFSVDGRLAAVNDSKRKTLSVVDLGTGQNAFPPLADGFDARKSVAFSPDGRLVATAVKPLVLPKITQGAPKLGQIAVSRIDFLDTGTGRPVGEPIWIGHEVGKIQFSPDGRLLAIALSVPLPKPVMGITETITVRGVQFWDVATRKALGEPYASDDLTMGPIAELIFSPDGRRLLATRGRGGAMSNQRDFTPSQLLDVATSKPVGPPLSIPDIVMVGSSETRSESLKLAAFAPDGLRVACANGGSQARLFYAATCLEVGPPLKHNDRVTCIDFSRDGRSVATASDDRTVRIWDASTGAPKGAVLKLPDRAIFVAFLPDGRALVTVAADGSVRGWDARTGEPLGPARNLGGGKLTGGLVAPDGRVLLALLDGGVRSWNLPVDDRPASDLVLLSQLLAGSRIEQSGAILALSGLETHEAREVLWSKYPELFVSGPNVLLEWHRRQAGLAEQSRSWSEADFHLGRLIESEPRDPSHRNRRASVSVMMGRWDRASVDYAAVVAAKPDDASMRYNLVLTSLWAGKGAEARLAASDALERLGGTTDLTAANDLARLYSIAWSVVPDRIPRLADKALSATPKAPWRLYVAALAALRAGHPDRAAQLASQSIQVDARWFGLPLNWPILAMAHHRLGHDNEAHRWLLEATREANAGANARTMYWWDRQEFLLLTREAEWLITPPQLPNNPFAR
jgi:eukaryotic-like serine/threonine-protein kinase